MDVRSFISDAFGIVLMGSAVALAAWELLSHRLSTDRWLHPRGRLWRRMVLALLLGAVGILLNLEARHVLPTSTPRGMLTFVLILGFLALALLLLALFDILRMLDLAVKHSVREMHENLESSQDFNSSTGRTDEPRPH